MNRSEIITYAAVFLFIIMGVTQSLYFNSWQHFGNTGSLIVITGALLAYRDYVFLLGDKRVFYQNHFKKLLTKMEKSKPSGIISGVMHEGKTDNIKKDAKEIDTLLVLARQRLQTIEAIVIILGTFIWGYGAIISELIWPLKHLTIA